jgi:hypothetical protein
VKQFEKMHRNERVKQSKGLSLGKNQQLLPQWK